MPLGWAPPAGLCGACAPPPPPTVRVLLVAGVSRSERIPVAKLTGSAVFCDRKLITSCARADELSVPRVFVVTVVVSPPPPPPPVGLDARAGARGVLPPRIVRT